MTSLGVSPPVARIADLAGCFAGSGDASCFQLTSSSAALNRIAPADVSGPPLSLTSNVSGSTVGLSWTSPATGDPVATYVIEGGSGPGLSNLVNAPVGLATSLSFPGIPQGTYYARVRAQNNSGLSAPSNEVVIVVGGDGSSGACAASPRNLTVLSQSAGTFALGWQAPDSGSPVSYIVRAGSSPGLVNLADFNTGNTSLVLSVANVPAGSYHVRVHSVSNCGISAPSNEVLVFAVGFTSDVQISVSWDAPSDVDLHVVEPSGEEIFYDNVVSSTGGQLDVDSNPDCEIDGRQIENIRWPGQAPAGTYTVRVDYFRSCDVSRTNYLVTVKNGASVQTFTGFFTGPGDQGGVGSGVTIGTFVRAASDAIQNGVLRLFRAPEGVITSPRRSKRAGGR